MKTDKERYAERKNRGVCVGCGRGAPAENYVDCQACIEKKLASRKAVYLLKTGREYQPRKRVPALILPTDVGVIGYLSGLLDGEGSISISASTKCQRQVAAIYHTVTVQIHNSDERLMLWLMETIGGGVRLKTGPNPLSDKPQYEWYICTAGDVLRFLCTVLPYLVIKKERAQLAIEFCELGWNRGSRRLNPVLVQKREAFRLRLVKLNGYPKQPKAQVS